MDPIEKTGFRICESVELGDKSETYDDALNMLGPEYSAVNSEQFVSLYWKSKEK